jgi:hypothetical protein
MIAQAGLLSYRMGFETPLEDSTCTQRFCGIRIHHLSTSHSAASDLGLMKYMFHGVLDFSFKNRISNTSGYINTPGDRYLRWIPLKPNPLYQPL